MQNRLNNISNAQVGFILSILAFVGLGFSAFSHIQSADINWWQWADGAFQNFSTEVIGAILTFGLIEVLVGGREKRQADEAQQKVLLRQTKEQRRNLQLQAISDLKLAETPKKRQPIIDRMKASNLFKGADLAHANLEEAYLGSANLEKANLADTNFKGASLQGANLSKTDLWSVNLESSDLRGANFKGSYLRGANLRGTDIRDANFKEANLGGSNLERADIKNTSFAGASLYKTNLEKTNLCEANLEGSDLRHANLKNVVWERKSDGITYTAILPDGNKWTPDTDMTRFTDPEHPNSWRPA